MNITAPDHPLAAWHALVQGRDTSGLPALLADEVVFHSPVVHTPQRGRPIVSAYLTAALAVIGNDAFRYVRQIVGEREAVLEFVTTIDGVQVNGIDLITWNAQGLIVDFKVMIRPLKAIELIHRTMGQMLASRAGGVMPDKPA